MTIEAFSIDNQPFTADIVRRALNTRNVLIPERFASTPGARVTYLREREKWKHLINMTRI